MDPTTIAQTLAAYAQQPARPATPTPATQDDITAALYGARSLPSPMQPPPPLPSWVPQNVQNYINTRPSYAEGERQAAMQPDIAGGEPYSPTPQIEDIRRLFQGRITQNAPTGDIGNRAQQLRSLMKLPGFSGFTGGDEI